MRISRCAIYEILLFHLFLVFYALSFPLKDDWGATALLLLVVCILLFLEYQRTRLFVSPLFFWFAFWLGAIVLGRMYLTDAYPLYQEWGMPLLRLVTMNTAGGQYRFRVQKHASGGSCDYNAFTGNGGFRVKCAACRRDTSAIRRRECLS